MRDGKSGWILPIRDPEAFIAQLRWCDAHRDRLADMVRDSYLKFQPRDWSHVAGDLQRIYREALGCARDSSAGARRALV